MLTDDEEWLMLCNDFDSYTVVDVNLFDKKFRFSTVSQNDGVKQYSHGCSSSAYDKNNDFHNIKNKIQETD